MYQEPHSQALRTLASYGVYPQGALNPARGEGVYDSFLALAP